MRYFLFRAHWWIFFSSFLSHSSFFCCFVTCINSSLIFPINFHKFRYLKWNLTSIRRRELYELPKICSLIFIFKWALKVFFFIIKWELVPWGKFRWDLLVVGLDEVLGITGMGDVDKDVVLEWCLQKDAFSSIFEGLTTQTGTLGQHQPPRRS